MDLPALLLKLSKESLEMTRAYKNQIRHTGGLLTESMAFAYRRGIIDIMTLIAKEIKNEEPVQTKEG